MKTNLLVAFVLLASGHGVAGAQARIDWQLANNFPFFKSREALQAYVATAAQGVAANGKVQDAPSRKLPEGFLDEVASVDEPADLRAIFSSQRPAGPGPLERRARGYVPRRGERGLADHARGTLR